MVQDLISSTRTSPAAGLPGIRAVFGDGGKKDDPQSQLLEQLKREKSALLFIAEVWQKSQPKEESGPVTGKQKFNQWLAAKLAENGKDIPKEPNSSAEDSLMARYLMANPEQHKRFPVIYKYLCDTDRINPEVLVTRMHLKAGDN